MFARIFFLCTVWLSNSVFAAQTSFYQVDMILFTHLQNTLPPKHGNSTLLLPPKIAKAISLSPHINKGKIPYHRLATTQSGLGNEFWGLNRHPEYQIVLHYSWLIPKHQAKPVLLEVQNKDNWSVSGVVSIQNGQYMQLNTELLFSLNQSSKTAFMFKQKKRLKTNVVYYFDHPQAGMFIKIHPLF